MDETGDSLNRLIRRTRALRAEAERLRLYVVDAAGRAAEICIESERICQHAEATRRFMARRRPAVEVVVTA